MTPIDALVAELPPQQREILRVLWGARQAHPKENPVTVRWGGCMSKALENFLRLGLMHEIEPNRWGHRYDITPLGKGVAAAIEDLVPAAEVLEKLCRSTTSSPSSTR